MMEASIGDSSPGSGVRPLSTSLRMVRPVELQSRLSVICSRPRWSKDLMAIRVTSDSPPRK
jgi:hypothetical protein